ncbi:shikimate dehydrogenase [Methanoculleus sp. 7T]|uniref:shikimate dehydrogenase n=1 Tax=Methanoculleus sp. 7T TaxID=2937282 RepID=UPI0020BF3F04|nr:shikimate dehydrogenase [Methanoculleus sp. 7T]MCK8519694.1 shikimate dehydrogenase [Methanoculleus sp. 7T]
MKVVLTGFRGTGKTSVGRILADRLQAPFFDTDTLVERRAGMPIPEIFRRHGEAHFRALEREAIASLRTAEGVISTGGGAVSDPANVADLRWHGTVFLLSAPPDVIHERIAGSDRPGLTGLPPAEEVQTLLARRKEAYLGAADTCIDTGRRMPDEVADLILRDAEISPDEKRERDGLLGRLGLSDLGEMIDQDPGLRVCAIAGNPCAHSKSPLLYNRLFAHFGMHYRYTRFEWPDAATIIRLANLLPLKGLSVTIPFKADVMRHIDEVDDHAAAIGAVNTVVRCGGRMYGHNTDWLGVRAPLAHRRGARAVVLGAGGAAAAAVYALVSLDMDVTVLARTPDAARRLAERFGCRWGALEDFRGSNADVVVHATPVGMEPDTRSLLAPGDLRAGTTVFDLVYTPPETPLIRAAKEAGCEVIPGTEMFVHQAAEQFRLITGIAVSPELVREMLA